MTSHKRHLNAKSKNAWELRMSDIFGKWYPQNPNRQTRIAKGLKHRIVLRISIVEASLAKHCWCRHSRHSFSERCLERYTKNGKIDGKPKQKHLAKFSMLCLTPALALAVAAAFLYTSWVLSLLGDERVASSFLKTRLWWVADAPNVLTLHPTLDPFFICNFNHTKPEWDYLTDTFSAFITKWALFGTFWNRIEIFLEPLFWTSLESFEPILEPFGNLPTS